MRPITAAALALLALTSVPPAGAAPATGSALCREVPLAPVAVYRMGGRGPLAGARLVADPAEAALVLDLPRALALDANGDVIASGAAVRHDPAAVVEAVRVGEALGRLSRTRPLQVAVHPGSTVHPGGSVVRIAAGGIAGRFVTVFGLTASGTVELLWPRSVLDPDPWPAARPFGFDAVVAPPFGSDTVVVVTTPGPPGGLRAMVRGGGHVRPARLYEAVSAAMRDGDAALGVAAVFTEPGWTR